MLTVQQGGVGTVSAARQFGERTLGGKPQREGHAEPVNICRFHVPDRYGAPLADFGNHGFAACR